MAKLGDTLTTREALRLAVVDDIIGRAQAAAVAVEGDGPLAGVEVVSLGRLREIAQDHLGVKLPPPLDTHAEVSTPATITVSAICPECDLPTKIVGKINPELKVTDDGAELGVKWKAKAVDHNHNQLPLEEVGDQVTVDEELASIDDLRLRILRAVADVSDRHADEHDPGPPSSLDAVAAELERVSESERSDLEDALYGYREQGFVEIVSTKGVPPTYVLTEAGLALVAAADEEADVDDNEQDDAA
jgi:hypothetical protein